MRSTPHGWDLDMRRHEISWRGRVIPATAIEFLLLETLIERIWRARAPH